jgi:hypothetical protein
MLTSLAAKSFLASDKGLATAFVGLFTGSVTYLAVAIERPNLGHTPNHTLTLVSASNDHAVVGSDEGLRRVTVGAVIPTLGQVVKIERRDGRWSVVFSSGKVLTTGKTTGFAIGADS